MESLYWIFNRKLKNPKTEVCVATTEEKELFLLVGNERIQIPKQGL